MGLLQTRVVQFASGDLWAGAEVQLFNLCKDLAARENISLSVVLLNDGELCRRLRDAGIQVLLLDESRHNALSILLRLTAFLRRCRPRIVHTHRQKENVIGSLACLLAGAIPSLRTVHGAPEFHFRPWQIHKLLFRFLDRFFGRHLQKRIVAVSDELRGKLLSYYPLKQIEIVENGIGIDYVRQQSEAPAEWSDAGAKIKFAIVARLVPVKRIDLFIEMAKLISTDNKDISFYIFGDGPLRDILTGTVGNASECISFMGFRNNILPYLRQMNALFITSDHEGLPMNLLEAMCLRIPVIAHATGGIPAVLADGTCGTLVHEQTAQAYAEAARSFLSSPELFAEKAERGYRELRERYSSDRMGERYIDIYNNILGDDRNKGGK